MNNNAMKRLMPYLWVAAAVLLIAAGAVSCRNSGRRLLTVENDSLAYIIGMNVGHNLLQIDSTLDIDVVCAAIRDVYAGSAKMSMTEARNYYLRQMNYSKYEKFKLYEERFLSDLAKTNRSYVRTRTGVTYRISESGDQQTLASNTRDTLVLRYRLSLQDGTTVESSYERADTLRTALADLVKGLQEPVKMVGAGGHFDAWIPSDLAYGTDGNEELGIAPNSTLFYEVDVLNVRPYRRR